MGRTRSPAVAADRVAVHVRSSGAPITVESGQTRFASYGSSFPFERLSGFRAKCPEWWPHFLEPREGRQVCKPTLREDYSGTEYGQPNQLEFLFLNFFFFPSRTKEPCFTYSCPVRQAGLSPLSKLKRSWTIRGARLRDSITMRKCQYAPVGHSSRVEGSRAVVFLHVIISAHFFAFIPC